MKTKNGHILTFSEKMQISAISCFATCDWFCPMTSQLSLVFQLFLLYNGNIFLLYFWCTYLTMFLQMFSRGDEIYVPGFKYYNIHMYTVSKSSTQDVYVALKIFTY